MSAGILSERRAVPPFGLAGGEPGQRGRNLLLRPDGHVVSLGGKATLQLGAGDVLRIETPGGGGYGSPLQAAVAGGQAGGTGREPQLGVATQQTGAQGQRATLALATGSVAEWRRRQESA